MKWNSFKVVRRASRLRPSSADMGEKRHDVLLMLVLFALKGLAMWFSLWACENTNDIGDYNKNLFKDLQTTMIVVFFYILTDWEPKRGCVLWICLGMTNHQSDAIFEPNGMFLCLENLLFKWKLVVVCNLALRKYRDLLRGLKRGFLISLSSFSLCHSPLAQNYSTTHWRRLSWLRKCQWKRISLAFPCLWKQRAEEFSKLG